MRVIICGAGQVGYSIAAYLARKRHYRYRHRSEENRAGECRAGCERHRRTCDPIDVDQAGAGQADMIIAVTSSDEVNMVACQVAHSLFNVPRKIARIRERAFLIPPGRICFRAHLPVGIISPEVEVAKTIAKRLSVPGSTHLIPLADDRLYMVGLQCSYDTPLIETPLRQLTELFPDAPVSIIGIIREGRGFIPKAADQMMPGDEVFLVADAGQIEHDGRVRLRRAGAQHRRHRRRQRQLLPDARVAGDEGRPPSRSSNTKMSDRLEYLSEKLKKRHHPER